MDTFDILMLEFSKRAHDLDLHHLLSKDTESSENENKIKNIEEYRNYLEHESNEALYSSIFGKSIEAIIGIILLIPPFLGIIAFVLNMCGCDGDFTEMRNLSINWTNDFSKNGGGGMSAAPIFLGIMALAGAILVKGNLKYLYNLILNRKDIKEIKKYLKEKE